MSIGLLTSCGWIPCQLSFPSSNLFGYLGRFLQSSDSTHRSRHVSYFTQTKITKSSRKILSVQQYRTSTWWRNLNAFVTNRIHLPMKLSSDKALRANLCVDPCIEATCPSPVSVLPTTLHWCARSQRSTQAAALPRLSTRLSLARLKSP